MSSTHSNADGRGLRLLPTLLNVLVTAMSDPNRCSKGRLYARQGAVDDLDVQPGVLTASVQGSRSQPYFVEVQVLPAEAFDTPNELVPVAEEVSFDCTCPDWEEPCKHAVAVLSAFAELVGEEPDLLLLWRGASRPHVGERAVVGSRSGSVTTPPRAPAAVAAAPATLDPETADALREYLAVPAGGGGPGPDETLHVSRLAPPNAPWGELWAEMLTDALLRLSPPDDRR